MADSSLRPMNPLSIGSGSVNEWKPSSAFYSRVTLSQKCGLRRPVVGFCRSAGKVQWGAPGYPCSQYLRRDFLDLGTVSTALEMGKLDLTFVASKKKKFILAEKLKTPPYSKMKTGDIFQTRIQGSIPLIWQKWPVNPQLLCPVPTHLAESFPVVQEWQLLSDNSGFILRMDYLNYVPLQGGPNIHSAANLFKLKAALNIGADSNLIREVQQYHIVDSVYDTTRRTQILMNLGFFRGPMSSTLIRRPTPVLRVEIPELTTTMNQMPPEVFSDQALRELQGIKYRLQQKQQNRGSSF